MQLTITRISAPKTVNYTNKKTGNPDSFKKVGFQTQEFGDRWYDLAFRNTVPFKVGDKVELEIKERTWEGKTYYDAFIPKTASSAKLSELERRVSYIEEFLKIK